MRPSLPLDLQVCCREPRVPVEDREGPAPEALWSEAVCSQWLQAPPGAGAGAAGGSEIRAITTTGASQGSMVSITEQPPPRFQTRPPREGRWRSSLAGLSIALLAHALTLAQVLESSLLPPGGRGLGAVATSEGAGSGAPGPEEGSWWLSRRPWGAGHAQDSCSAPRPVPPQAPVSPGGGRRTRDRGSELHSSVDDKNPLRGHLKPLRLHYVNSTSITKQVQEKTGAGIESSGGERHLAPLSEPRFPCL